MLGVTNKIIMLSIVMLKVVKVNVVMLSVVTPCYLIKKIPFSLFIFYTSTSSLKLICVVDDVLICHEKLILFCP